MFTGGEEGIETELSKLLEFRNSHRDFWSERGTFDTESDLSGHLVIVRRRVNDREVMCVINTSGNATVELPGEYSSGWDEAFAHNVGNGQLEPYGFLVATR